jgi:lipoate-protein ligase A
VIGISGHPERWCNLTALESEHPHVSLLRFSGGGTVLLDPHGALMISMILNNNAIQHIQAYPRELMQWTATLYQRAFQLLESLQQKHKQQQLHQFNNNDDRMNATSIHRQSIA